MTTWVDLAARRLGGMTLAANDEFFAPKEHLLAPTAPVFDPHAYGDRGKVMDGWETRRRRRAGHDWCVIRLGVPGVLHEVVVDTSHFHGNFPERCWLEGCAVADDHLDDAVWHELLPARPLEGDTEHVFGVEAPWRVTHVRLCIHPDGGVARLRLRGEPVVDLRGAAGSLDLASVLLGGRAVDSSDAFFSSPQNLVSVGDSTHMGDGWETRRRRGPGHDWAVIALAAPGLVDHVEIDTTHYKGNYPDRCSVEGTAVAGRLADARWHELVAEHPMRPHSRHRFEAAGGEPVTHVRLNVMPDGGVARLRVHGRISDEGSARAGARWLSTLVPEQAEAELRACCAATTWTRDMLERRPWSDTDAVLADADEVAGRLSREDWQEAFEAHPRIGERGGGWSRREQAGTQAASDATLEALAAGNRAYEQRFGHVFLICASGKSAEQMRAALEQRLGNDPSTELQVAAEEHRKITRLRLEKLLRGELA